MQDDIEKTADNLVRSEVLLNVSHMVHELAQKEEYMDELLPVLVRDDYESAVYDEIQNADPETILSTAEQYDITTSDATALIFQLGECEDWQDIANFLDIDPHILEALEHWVVTDRLADGLEEQGEMIVRDFLGLTIWGRTTSGMAISADRVMHDVARALKARVAAMAS